jgi:hypothetical protein
VPRTLRLHVHLVRAKRRGRHLSQRPRGRSAGNVERRANLMRDTVDESEQVGSASGTRDDHATRSDVMHLHFESRVGSDLEDRPHEHRAGACMPCDLMTSRAICRRHAKLAEARVQPIRSNDIKTGRLRKRRHQHARHAVRQPCVFGITGTIVERHDRQRLTPRRTGTGWCLSPLHDQCCGNRSDNEGNRGAVGHVRPQTRRRHP